MDAVSTTLKKTIQTTLILSSISVMICQETGHGICSMWHDTSCSFDFYTPQSYSYELRSWKGTFSYPCLYGYLFSFPLKKEDRLFVNFS